MLDEEPDSEPAGADPVAERIDERELVDRIKAEFDAEELIEHPPDDDRPEDAEEGES
jgi:hypothetical protein